MRSLGLNDSNRSLLISGLRQGPSLAHSTIVVIPDASPAAAGAGAAAGASATAAGAGTGAAGPTAFNRQRRTISGETVTETALISPVAAASITSGSSHGSTGEGNRSASPAGTVALDSPTGTHSVNNLLGISSSPPSRATATATRALVKAASDGAGSGSGSGYSLSSNSNSRGSGAGATPGWGGGGGGGFASPTAAAAAAAARDSVAASLARVRRRSIGAPAEALLLAASVAAGEPQPQSQALVVPQPSASASTAARPQPQHSPQPSPPPPPPAVSAQLPSPAPPTPLMPSLSFGLGQPLPTISEETRRAVHTGASQASLNSAASGNTEEQASHHGESQGSLLQASSSPAHAHAHAHAAALAQQQSFSGTVFSGDDASTVLGSPMAGSASEHQLLAKARERERGRLGASVSDRSLVMSGGATGGARQSSNRNINLNQSMVHTTSTNNIFEPVLSAANSLQSMDTYNVSGGTVAAEGGLHARVWHQDSR
jgi:hypothetical protein